MVNQDPLFKNQFTLPKTGTLGITRILDAEHLPAILALQDETRRALSFAQKNFVLPQTAEYFGKFLSREVGVMIGVFTEDKLIGQMVLMGPLSPEEAMRRQAVTRNEINFHHVGPLDTIVAAKSMAVHPDYRGNEISQHMLAAILQTPLAQAADHVFAQISVENVRSWDLFLRNGFGIVAAGIDPIDNKPRFVLQKPLHGFAFDRSPSADEVDPVTDFSAIIRLTGREALVGRLDEMGSVSAPRLAFVATSEMSVAAPRAVNQAD
jgi:ribosomal protein S18 acetylase RimI-like enzyme